MQALLDFHQGVETLYICHWCMLYREPQKSKTNPLLTCRSCISCQSSPPRTHKASPCIGMAGDIFMDILAPVKKLPSWVAWRNHKAAVNNYWWCRFFFFFNGVLDWWLTGGTSDKDLFWLLALAMTKMPKASKSPKWWGRDQVALGRLAWYFRSLF